MGKVSLEPLNSIRDVAVEKEFTRFYKKKTAIKVVKTFNIIYKLFGVKKISFSIIQNLELLTKT